jgi:hypothetical protein
MTECEISLNDSWLMKFMMKVAEACFETSDFFLIDTVNLSGGCSSDTNLIYFSFC